MKYCQWQQHASAYQCEVCEVVRQRPTKRHCRGSAGPRRTSATPRVPEQCQHFGGYNGDHVEAPTGCGCRSETVLTAVAECQLHGRCTPIKKAKDQSIPYCWTCRDYTATGALIAGQG